MGRGLLLKGFFLCSKRLYLKISKSKEENGVCYTQVFSFCKNSLLWIKESLIVTLLLCQILLRDAKVWYHPNQNDHKCCEALYHQIFSASIAVHWAYSNTALWAGVYHTYRLFFQTVPRGKIYISLVPQWHMSQRRISKYANHTKVSIWKNFVVFIMTSRMIFNVGIKKSKQKKLSDKENEERKSAQKDF